MRLAQPVRALRSACLPLALAGFVLSSPGVSAAGSDDEDPEALIKAAMVYNFTKVVEWQARAPADSVGFIVGLVGHGATVDALRTIDGKPVGRSTLHVRVIDDPAELAPCQLVYFDRSGRDTLQLFLHALEGVPVLTVSDRDGFAEDGGVVQFARRQNRVRILVNLDAAERAKLKFSSQLLKIAEIIREKGRHGIPG
jgi:hypothetical protein